MNLHTLKSLKTIKKRVKSFSAFYFSIFLLFGWVQLSISSFNPICLPEPTGQYQVGLAKFELVNENQKELYYPAGRLIPIQIYFPTQKGVHNPQEKIFENHAPKKWKPLETKVFSQKKDLSSLAPEKHPLIILNHGDTVAMTDYASIAEDLASHGYVVLAIQHQLITDQDETSFLKERGISRYSTVINNILFVFEWSKKNQIALFHDKIDLKRVGLIGHSMGGNALLLLANRASDVFKNKERDTLLPHNDSKNVHECIIVLDTGGFPYPHHKKFPLLLLLSGEREEYQKKTGTYAEIIKLGHQVKYYKGSKHISFMDHGYINPPHPLNPKEDYFNGSLQERKNFFDQLRKDIHSFLKKNQI